MCCRRTPVLGQYVDQHPIVVTMSLTTNFAKKKRKVTPYDKLKPKYEDQYHSGSEKYQKNFKKKKINVLCSYAQCAATFAISRNFAGRLFVSSVEGTRRSYVTTTRAVRAFFAIAVA